MEHKKLEWNEKEQKKFEQIYNEYAKLMYYIAVDILKDEGLAQDAVQEAFINISKSFYKISEKDCQDLKGFIVIVIRRVSINMYNRRKRNNVISLESLLEKGIGKMDGLNKSNDILADALITSTDENKVVYYIHRLPAKYADVMLFYYVYGYTADEIAQMFEMSIATVYSYLSRGRKKLEKLLDGKKVLIG